MPLTPIEMPANAVALTNAEQRLVEAAGQALAELEHQQPQLSRILQQSDPVGFCAGLHWLRSHQLVRGQRFCEWGSGIGLITALAALSGLDAAGIEAHPILVSTAQKTFPAGALGPRYTKGSFVPHQASARFQVVGTYGATIWQPSTDRDPYAALDLSCNDIDLIYAYPWPREIGLYEALFELCASPGALLWLFIQGGAPRLVKKTA